MEDQFVISGKMKEIANKFMDIAPKYPNIYYLDYGVEVFAGTKVEFDVEENGNMVRYRRLVVEGIRKDLGDSHLKKLTRMLQHSVEMAQTFSKPCSLDERLGAF